MHYISYIFVIRYGLINLLKYALKVKISEVQGRGFVDLKHILTEFALPNLIQMKKECFHSESMNL